MKNWSGNQQWNPSEFLQPSSSDEIISIVKKAVINNQKIRVFGSKHSFTAINNTDAICLNLDNYQGLLNVDKSNNYVTVKAGTKLYNLTKLLSDHDLAMENMGDIDQQSIAGAISTGTHGTGITFGNISTQVVAIKFINGLGEEIYCSEEDNLELFKCLQISLGTFGIITEITLRCVPNYKLKLEKKAEKLDAILSHLSTINKENRNFEFYWLPYTNSVQTKYSNISTDKADKDNFINYFNDVLLENYVFKLLCNSAKWFPSLNVGVSKFSSAFLSSSTKVKDCKDVYATPRLVKFNEMEYNVPLDAYQDVIKDITKLINSKKFNIHFPLENRFVQQDDIYLSPAYKRDSAYIACHVYKGKEFKQYFKALEEVFSNYDARPHWGKMHFKKVIYFQQTYPMFTLFNKKRRENDPNHLFLNHHLQQIFI
jgi:FAD-linked oxidoreductase